jgi:hypothetical protein
VLDIPATPPGGEQDLHGRRGLVRPEPSNGAGSPVPQLVLVCSGTPRSVGTASKRAADHHRPAGRGELFIMCVLADSRPSLVRA